MKISEVADRTGLSVTTIRYYEKSGLCAAIARGPDGKRRFSKNDLDWLTLLFSLRETGMPAAEMQDFAALYLKGSATIPERKARLAAHDRRLDERQAQLDRCKALLAYKLARYAEIMGELA
ncbi:MerR family transcriptional regulator [Frigidibacter sp.]|uniref:MerR family transcriptional regulator n=1 Tax=Frigidibacter sp. TaxID=2586418 RepID=UPI002732D462|nr:MerR family transcriptional regulator [Frigidibacter sp.]MDP3340989.1 MerR family transcriptional regulator [Frigidibacter sp.]